MSLTIILQAGVATGTALLFATLGEILTERSGILNLGVEGMMLLGAMTSYAMSNRFGNPWIGIAIGMLAAGLISQVHAFITVTLQADQVVSGLSLNFLATGISLVLGEGLNSLSGVPLIQTLISPCFRKFPLLAMSFLRGTAHWFTLVI